MLRILNRNPKRLLSILLLVLVVATVLGLRQCHKSKKIESSAFSVGLIHYKGQFVTFQYPSSAQLKIVSAKESYLLGPIVAAHPPSPTHNTTSTRNSQQPDSKYTYQIHIQVHDNPMHLRTDDWVQDHLTSEWKQTQGGPSILPITHDGHLMEDFVSHVRVGKAVAMMIDTFGSDYNTRSLYFAKDNVVIEISFLLYPSETEPLALMQKDIYALILGTLDFAH